MGAYTTASATYFNGFQPTKVVHINKDPISPTDPCHCLSGKNHNKCGLSNSEEHQKLVGQKT